MTRAAAYIRVSKEQAGQVSPDSQRSEIAAYCERKGWTVTEWFEDIDISGRTDKRPGLQAMLRRAQDGEFEAVVFYRIDRLSREPMHHYAILAALKEAGVAVDSVGLPLEDNPESAFMWDLSAALAKLESLRLGKRLRSMHAELARQGKYAGNQPPFGWQRVRDPDGQQRLVLDPAEAPWRVKMHEWYQAGWSVRDIARELNREQVPTRRGADWTTASVRRMLAKPMQTGARLVDGQEYATGRIEPLISQETYERTMALIEARKNGPLPGRPSERPIPAGLLVCGNCGSRLYAGKTAVSSREGAVPYYCCTSRTRGGLCTRGPYIRESVLLAYVEPLLLEHLSRITVRPRSEPAMPDISPLRAEAEAIEISLARLACAFAEGTLPDAEYTRASGMQRAKLARVKERIHRATGAIEKATLRQALGPVRFTRQLWEILPTGAKQQIYQLAIETIIVNPKPDLPRIQVIWK